MAKLTELTKEKLVKLYYKVEKRSLEDIGSLYNASRVAVYKKLKKLGSEAYGEGTAGMV